jgi:hypothetical protein
LSRTAKSIRALLIAGILVGFTWGPTVNGTPLMCEQPETCEGGYGGLFCDNEAVMQFCDNLDDCWIRCGGSWVQVTCGLECHGVH